MLDLSNVPTDELIRAAGIMMCERMLYSRPKELEAVIDARIALLEAEIEYRRSPRKGAVSQEETDGRR